MRDPGGQVGRLEGVQVGVGFERRPVADHTRCVIDELSAYAPLSPEDLSLIAAAARRAEAYGCGAMLQAGTKGEPRAGVILSGWACEQRLLLDGRRQVFSILTPGDTVVIYGDEDLGGRSVTALTRMEFVDLSACVAPGTISGLATAFDAAMARHRLRFLDHMVRLGRQTSRERMVHLLLELRDRLEVKGLVKANSFRIPLTQDTLADSLGLSVVHINRTVQELRREGLIELRAGSVTLLRPDALYAIVRSADTLARRFGARAPQAAARSALPAAAFG